MFADPKLVRSNRITISLNQYEYALIEALGNYTGREQAPLVRDLALQGALEVVSPIQVNLIRSESPNPAPQLLL